MISASPDINQDSLLLQLTSAFHALTLLGWQSTFYAPKGPKLLLIEVGSTGVHRGFRDTIGFWIVDEMDTWPSNPVLFKLLEH